MKSRTLPKGTGRRRIQGHVKSSWTRGPWSCATDESCPRRLPVGKRRRDLHEAYTAEVFTEFADRILSFDRAAAEALPELTQRARAAGRTVSFADSMIGAIAAAQGFSVATRDTSPFEAMGIRVINPWSP